MASKRSTPTTRRSGLSTHRWTVVGSGIVLILVAVLVGWSLASSRSGVAEGGSDGTVVQGSGGQWTNITPEKLGSMLQHKDFTLLNVKTPYIGEIAGTDLYIPYTTICCPVAPLRTMRCPLSSAGVRSHPRG